MKKSHEKVNLTSNRKIKKYDIEFLLLFVKLIFSHDFFI